MKPGKVFLLLILLAAIIIAASLQGCTTSKDNKAFVRVISNPKLADKTFKELEKTRPCITAPIQYRKGSDIILIDTTFDEDQLNHFIDSLLNKECPDAKIINIDSLKSRIKKECKPVTYLRVDTILQQDERRIKQLEKDYNILFGENLALTVQKEKENERGNRWALYFCMLLALGLLPVFLYLRKENKKGNPSRSSD